MHSKTNRENHNFQILHFLVGGCHTVDGAYALLCDLLESRSDALAFSKATALRSQAKARRAALVIERNDDEIAVLDARADLAEVEATRETGERCVAAAIAEIAFIKDCMERLESHRKFKALSLPEAHEMAQREEWCGELIRRGENFLVTQGTIPADEFNTMRCHPDFDSVIYPALNLVKGDIKAGKFVLNHSQVSALLPAPDDLLKRTKEK